MPPYLPEELKRQITQYLPRSSLSNVSLVSQAWQTSAQSTLFQDFKIEPNRHYEGLFRPFALLLTSPHIATYIFRLNIVGPSKPGTCREVTVEVEEILSLVALAPSLQQLVVHNCIIYGPTDVPPPDPDDDPPHPVELEISNTTFDEIAFYMLVTSLCGTKLKLQNVRLCQGQEANEFPALSPASLSSLQSLDILGMQEHELDDDGRIGRPIFREKWRAVDILALCPDTLTSFGFGVDFGTTGIDGLVEILRMEGRHLEHLKLDFSSAGYAYDPRVDGLSNLKSTCMHLSFSRQRH